MKFYYDDKKIVFDNDSEAELADIVSTLEITAIGVSEAIILTKG